MALAHFSTEADVRDDYMAEVETNWRPLLALAALDASLIVGGHPGVLDCTAGSSFPFSLSFVTSDASY